MAAHATLSPACWRPSPSDPGYLGRTYVSPLGIPAEALRVPVFVFPGQGSQRPGMGRSWRHHPSWDVVAEASEVAGRDLGWLLVDADPEDLIQTRNAQLATLTLSLVVLDAVERLGIEPTACAGHSLGEYSALVAAGALSLDDGVAVVTERGDAMQMAADDRPGTMKMILGLDDATAQMACDRAGGEVWVANYNAPGNVVIAGDYPSIDAAGRHAVALGARKVVAVPVGGAFHTPLMAPAGDRLAKVLRAAAFREPEVAVVANVDARPHRSAEDWQEVLTAQLCRPVRWHQSALRLSELVGDDRVFIELGAGGVLSGLIGRVLPGATAVAVITPADLEAVLEAVLGRRALHGEHLHVPERMVISPCAGVFAPAAEAVGRDGSIVVGTVLGRIGAQEIRSPFAGRLMGMLALAGERLRPGQPVAWLRAG